MKVKRNDNNKPTFASKGLIVKPTGQKWFDNEVTREAKIEGTSLSPGAVSNLKNEAETLFYQDIASYRKVSEKRKDFAWIHTVLRSGTMCDKISAQVILIQDSPIHNHDCVEKMVNMVHIKDKRECLMSMDTLRDLFISDLLKENRKLNTFEQHPLEELKQATGKSSELRNKTLVLWYFEDKLKSIYANFVKNLKLVTHDTVEKTKQKAVSVMAELLKCSPEQEHFLLENLVNKIGDPSPKVGAHVCHLLGQIMDFHPNMKSVVSQEVERLLFRPNICERTKYYCLCVLNQIILSREDQKIANHLIKMYFGLFKLCVRKGEVNNKIMSALLSGVTRAHPYAALEENDTSEQLNTMYKMVHMVSFNVSVQALLLIFQVLDSKDSVSERFYSVLYRKLLDPAIGTSSRHSLFLNLVHRALKKDVSSKRVKAFVKRLIQISLYQAPHLQCGILYVISDLAKAHPNLLDVINTAAFGSDSEDDEEHYEDVVEEDDEHASDKVREKPTKLKVTGGSSSTSSWVHKQIQNSASGRSKSNYDPHCRNPLYAGAEYCNMWELRFLRKCFHPSVSLFAQQVSSNQEIKYSGDPLQDFTLARFLERFVYKNPKKPSEGPADLHRKVFGPRSLYVPSGSRQIPVTSEEYLHQNEVNVPAEENFIFRFLRQQAQSGKRKKDDDDSDIESVNSDEFEEILDKYKAEDDGKDTLDFVKELSTQKQRKSKKSEDVHDDDDDDFGSLESGSDLEDPDFGSDEDFEGAFEEFDDDLKEADEMKECEDFDEMKECEDFDEDVELASGRLSKPVKKKKKQRFEEENLFASVDEFSSLLEDNSKVESTTAEAFVNKDKSDAKQILWEKKRDQYVRGVDWKSRKHQNFRKGPKKFRKFGNKLKKNKK